MVETEANGDPVHTKERGGSFLDLFVGLFVPVQEIFGLPWLLYSAQDKKIFSFIVQYTISIHLSLIAQQAGRQSCWVARHLVVCVSGKRCVGQVVFVLVNISLTFISLPFSVCSKEG